MKRILLTTDFSDESRRAYKQTAAVAKGLGMGITLVHVVLDVRSLPQGAPLAPPVSSPEITEELEEAHGLLDKEIDLVRAHDKSIDVKTELLTGEHVAKALAVYAKKHDVAMISISTNGRTGLSRVFLGSVAEEVVRYSPVPVMTFPPGE